MLLLQVHLDRREIAWAFLAMMNCLLISRKGTQISCFAVKMGPQYIITILALCCLFEQRSMSAWSAKDLDVTIALSRTNLDHFLSNNKLATGSRTRISTCAEGFLEVELRDILLFALSLPALPRYRNMQSNHGRCKFLALRGGFNKVAGHCDLEAFSPQTVV